MLLSRFAFFLLPRLHALLLSVLTLAFAIAPFSYWRQACRVGSVWKRRTPPASLSAPVSSSRSQWGLWFWGSFFYRSILTNLVLLAGGSPYLWESMALAALAVAAVGETMRATAARVAPRGSLPAASPTRMLAVSAKSTTRLGRHSPRPRCASFRCRRMRISGWWVTTFLVISLLLDPAWFRARFVSF